MIRNTQILLAAAVLATGAFAQNKAAVTQQLQSLEQQASAASAAGNATLAAQLKRQYLALSERTGFSTIGLRAAPVAAPSASAVGGPSFIVAPANCSGAPGTTYPAVPGGTGPIFDYTTLTTTATVSGITNPIWDVDLFLAITHTWNSDLAITLTSPTGTACDISSGNGGAADDVFNGTLFDDQSGSSVTSYVYSTGVLVPDIRPEQSLNTTFRGQNANGVWTLDVADNAGGDIGDLWSWEITITDGTTNPPPPLPTSFNPAVNFTSQPNLGIIDNAIVSDTISVTGVSGSVWDVNVSTQITHTWCADMRITLIAPNGQEVILSNQRGGAYDDVFNGTLFDQSSLNPIASYVFSNGVAAPDLQPDQSLTNFWAPCPFSPNGTWELAIADLAGGDIGVLAQWDLSIVTAASGCSSAVATFCTPSTTTSGCNPVMSASGSSASIAAGAGSFILTASSVEGQKQGLIFYSITGVQSLPWSSGSTSFLCVKSPTQRSAAASSGGVSGTCGGSLSLDFFAFMAANPTAVGQPIAPGQHFDAQAWFRDPPAAKTTNLSNGIGFNLCP